MTKNSKDKKTDYESNSEDLIRMHSWEFCKKY